MRWAYYRGNTVHVCSCIQLTAHADAKPSSSLTEETVYSKTDEASGCGLWTDVCLQCAQSYNVGHALLIILLCQKFASAAVDDDSMDPMEQVKKRTVLK